MDLIHQSTHAQMGMHPLKNIILVVGFYPKLVVVSLELNYMMIVASVHQ